MNLKDLRRPVLRWAMRWPGDSTWMGPPRLPPAKMVEVAAESKNEIPELIPVHPAGQIFRKKPAIPMGCPPHPAFDIPVAPQTPTYLARIPHGRVVGPTVAVLTSADRMLADVSLDWDHPGLEHFAYRRFRLPRCRDFQGSALLLACTGADTYFHWLTDALPRLGIAEKAKGVHWKPDFLVVNTLDRAFVRETLSILGIPPNRIVSLDKFSHIRFSELWVPSLPCESSSGDPPGWAAIYLQNKFLDRVDKDKSKELPTRIWIDRSANKQQRVILTSKDKFFIKKKGFEIVRLEEMPLEKQIKLFWNSEKIAGPHGAGFSGIIFCKAADILEFFNSNYINACYYSLSQYADLTYKYKILKEKESFLHLLNSI
jgi:capsular polysaccharide biosynthesis protein